MVLKMEPLEEKIPLPIPSMGRTVYLYTYMKTIKINQMKVDIPWMDPVVFYLHEKTPIKINHPWESVNIPITRPNGTSYAWVKTDKPPGGFL